MANPDPSREELAAEVAAKGLDPVARRLGVPKVSLAYFLAGASRQGTAELIANRWLATKDTTPTTAKPNTPMPNERPVRRRPRRDSAA